MLKEDNELLCRVGAGTPMGQLMRQYWIPALLSTELPQADCPPVRVRLLGENLIAFRDTQGRVGMLANNCSHRGASLFFGRNEENGLRCVYHGWKYDVDGRCARLFGRIPNQSPIGARCGSQSRTIAPSPTCLRALARPRGPPRGT